MNKHERSPFERLFDRSEISQRLRYFRNRLGKAQSRKRHLERKIKRREGADKSTDKLQVSLNKAEERLTLWKEKVDAAEKALSILDEAHQEAA